MQLGHSLLLFTGIGQHLLQALTQVAGLPGYALLQLAQLQLQRLAAGINTGLAGLNLATDRLQAPGCFFTDAGKALLGRHQLLLHQRDLLEAPPAQARQRDERSAKQRPQRPRAGTTGGFLPAAHHVRRYQFVIINGARPQGRHIIVVIVSMVTHGYIQPR